MDASNPTSRPDPGTTTPERTAPRRAGTDFGEPERRTSRRGLMVGVVAVAIVGATALASTGFLGHNGSSKFSSVGSAIGGGDEVSAGSRSTPTAKRSSGNLALGVQQPGPSVPTPTDPAAAPADTTPPPADPLGNATALTAGRHFVSNGSLTVRTDNLGDAKQKAILAVESKGGGLFGEASTFDGDAKSVLTFKVVPTTFRPLLTEMEGLGQLLAGEVKTDDVTQQVIDLDARIAAASTSLDRTRTLLDDARTLADIGALDGEVSRRQAELETLKGQQQTLADRTDLATIVLTLVHPRTVVSATPAAATGAPTEDAGSTPGFGDGLRVGWNAFTEAGSVVLAVVGALLPFMIVVVPAALGSWLALRRRDRRRTLTAA